MLAATAIAAPITQNQAQQAAVSFLSKHHPGKVTQLKPVNNHKFKSSGANASFYIFNATGNQGFVIVSGDDRTTPVLGYVDNGNFDPNNIPANMKAWLEGYEEQISMLDEMGITATYNESFTVRPTRNSISPMITSHWDQGAPYWEHCPEFMDIDENGDTVGELAYTGCVAVSMSQILNYYKSPLRCTQIIPSYLVTYYWQEEYGAFDTEPLDPIFFDWDNMRDNYTGAETQAEKDAVAWLMLYAGCAAQMQYGVNASSTSDPYIPTALNEYFNYDAKLVYRSDYEQAEWEDMIYNELVEGRPLIYNGRAGSGGGHSFVCDGYAYGDLFHINWGWGGLGDGYFVLSVLNPYAGGIGSTTSLEGYNIDQTAVIGIQPGYSGTPVEVDHRLTVFNMYYTGTSSFERSDDGNFKLNKRRYIKVTGEDHIDDGTKYLRGIALYDSNDNFIDIIAQTYYAAGYLSITDSWPDTQSSVTYPFGNGLPNGSYKIKPVCSLPGTNEWQPMIESDRFYVEATINGDWVTMTNHPIVDLQSMNFEFTGGEKVGLAEQCHVTVKNNSADRFSGKLYLYVDNEQFDEYSEFTTVVEAEIPAGGTKVITFNFTPKNDGAKSAHLSIYDTSSWNPGIPGTGSVNIAGSVTYPMNLSVDINALNADENMNIYDSHIKFKVDVTNNTEGEYNRYILAPLFIVDENNHGTMVTYLSRNVVIPAGETQTFYFEFDNLAFGSVYALNIFGRNENEQTTNLVPPGGSKFYTINHGMVVWDGNGNRVGYKPYNGIRVPDNAAAVSLEGLNLTSLIPNENPNTLFYIGNGEKYIPAGLEAKNVIKNNVAQRDVVLKHGYDFYAPYRFTAANISYERTFTTGRHAGQQGGWSTMVLPFAATAVTADGTPIDWMHSKTDAKGLWVCNFDQEEDTSDDAKLLAEYVGNTMEANVPYFVAPYDGANGTDMRDKTFVFSATNVLVKPNPSAITSGTYHMTVGTYAQQTIEDAFFLNAAGSHFVKAANGTVKAFEAYAGNVRASEATMLQIVLDEIAEGAPSYTRGDVNDSGTVDITDVTVLIDYLLAGDDTAINLDAADTNIDTFITIADVTKLIDYLLSGTW